MTGVSSAFSIFKHDFVFNHDYNKILNWRLGFKRRGAVDTGVLVCPRPQYQQDVDLCSGRPPYLTSPRPHNV